MAILISKLLEISPSLFFTFCLFPFFLDLLFCRMPCPFDVCFLYAFQSFAERPQRQFSSFTLPHFSRVVIELCSFSLERSPFLWFSTSLHLCSALPFLSFLLFMGLFYFLL
uniref:Uncharacterized protein n=1 Tax=Ixodes scapularis TaxID=6945 RepID=A0A4D5S7Q8_IXOSC